MVIIGWYSFYFVVLVLEGVTSLSRNRDINYYDGSRGRMDRSSFTEEEFFQRNGRPKRAPHSPNLWAKSSDSQGVSCPTRLRENSLDTLSDSDRMKEVVHVPCPKRKSSGAKVVASFKGKSPKYNSGLSHRGARDFKKNPRGDLNQAVKQNAQWLIMSAQDRNQKSNQGSMGPNNPPSKDQMGQSGSMNQQFQYNHQGLSASESASWRYPKGAKEEPRKTQYGKPALNPPQNAAIPLKPTQSQQYNVHAPPIPRLKETGTFDVGQPFSVAPNPGHYNLGPLKSVQAPQVVEPSPFMKKDPKSPYENNRFLMNSYNMTYDGPHHSPSPNPPSYNINAPNPLGQLHYPNVQTQLNPQFFQSHASPGSSPGYAFNTYLVVYDATFPTVGPKVYPNTSDTRHGPWSPGALEFDIPPGYAHQPKIPRTTTRSYDAVNIKDLPKVDPRIPLSSNQPNLPNGNQGQHPDHQPFLFESPQQDSWRYQGNPPDSHQQPYSNSVKEEPQMGSYDMVGMSPALEKSTQAYKGVFGKLKKEETKIKLLKPNKINAYNAHGRGPPANQLAQGSAGQTNAKSINSNAKPDESAPYPPHHELRPIPIPQNLSRNEAVQIHAQPKMTNSRGAIPHRKLTQEKSLSVNRQDHQNFSGDMSHILDPPITMETNLFTNKALKIASKFVNSEDVTYVPFRGVPHARNDEAFYDKSVTFLGRIDRPPLVNIKKRKWTKLGRRFNNERFKLMHADYPMGFYSEPADFHSDMSVEDLGTAQEPKSNDRHHRKCHNKRGRFRPDWNIPE